MNSSLINCPHLPAFAWDNLEATQCAFDGVPALALRQSWLPKEEPDFAPASVRIGWGEESLFVFAELSDADIFTRAAKHNERMWELGDVFEMFLRPDGQAAYTELHVTPNNFRLQLRFADAQALEQLSKTNTLERALINGQIFYSAAWVQSAAKRWYVSAKIPAAAICERVEPLADSQWHFSFSRYDYTRGRTQPVISSSSPHALPKFHRQQEWRQMRFEARPRDGAR